MEMENIKQFSITVCTALYSLLFFKHYTIFSRQYEIACGVVAWGCILLMLAPILKHI